MNVTKLATWSWRVTLALYAALLAGLTLDHWMLRQSLSYSLWLFQALPLLLVLPGLVTRQPRGGIWLCFMLMFYFLLAIDALATGKHPVAHTALAAIVICLFTSSMLYARWQARAD